MDLERFIYAFNLSTTLTVHDVYEKCSVINNGRSKDINYADCVSLYDVVSTFNKSYLDYSKDTDRFRKILSELGEEVNYISHKISRDYSFLWLEVYKPFNIEGDYALVYFINDNGNFYATINNGKRLSSKNYMIKTLELDTTSECLDIVSRNDLFLEGYADLKDKFIFGDGTTVLFSKVNGDLLDSFETFTLTFGNSYMNSCDFIEVKFRLGEDFKILYDHSKVVLYDEEITNIDKKKSIINELLSGIYIHSDKLNCLYKNNSSENAVLRKEGK